MVTENLSVQSSDDEKEHEAEEAVPKKQVISQYALLMWDGLGFFGFSDTKLGRLKGEKVNWCTPLISWKGTPILIISIIVGMIIVISEVNNLGLQKSQTIDL